MARCKFHHPDADGSVALVLILLWSCGCGVNSAVFLWHFVILKGSPSDKHIRFESFVASLDFALRWPGKLRKWTCTPITTWSAIRCSMKTWRGWLQSHLEHVLGFDLLISIVCTYCFFASGLYTVISFPSPFRAKQRSILLLEPTRLWSGSCSHGTFWDLAFRGKGLNSLHVFTNI